MHPTVPQTIKILHTLYESGHSYSAINTARSALSTFIITSNGNPIGTHPLIRPLALPDGSIQSTPIFTKISVHLGRQHRPSIPQQIPGNSMEKLTYKLGMLIALITGQRCQTIHLMRLDNMQVLDD